MPAHSYFHKKKILLVLQGTHAGGAEKQALMLAARLKEKYSCDISIWNIQSGKPQFINEIEKHNFKYRSIIFPASKIPLKQKIKLWLWRIIFRFKKFDIVFSYLIYANVFSCLAAKNLRNTAVVWNQRDEGILNYEFDPQWLHAALKHTRLFISNSTGGAEYLKKSGADEKKFRIIKNGIDPGDFNTIEENNEFNKFRTEYSHIASMVANIHGNKDHGTLVKSWVIVCTYFKNKNLFPVLLLAGKEYAQANELNALINSLQMENQIKLLGFVNQVKHLLFASDIYVHSSNSEGTSNSIIEAMAAGKAIAATDIPSIRETVSSANYRFLSEPMNSERMAENIIFLLENIEESKRIGEQNQKFVLQNYEVSNMVEQTVKAVEEEFQHG